MLESLQLLYMITFICESYEVGHYDGQRISLATKINKRYFLEEGFIGKVLEKKEQYQTFVDVEMNKGRGTCDIADVAIPLSKAVQ